jgi:ribosomal protein S27AE
MKTAQCPEPDCGASFVITNHTTLAICPQCKKCVVPKERN